MTVAMGVLVVALRACCHREPPVSLTAQGHACGMAMVLAIDLDADRHHAKAERCRRRAMAVEADLEEARQHFVRILLNAIGVLSEDLRSREPPLPDWSAP